MPSSSRTLTMLATLALSLSSPAFSQETPKGAEKPKDAGPSQPYQQNPLRIFRLQHTGAPGQANEILVALRNILSPSIRIYLLGSTNTIAMAASHDQLEIAGQLIRELDVAHPAYRVTYTITTLDNGQHTGTAHFDAMMVDGQRTTLKQGSRVPVVTGTSKPETPASETQYQYLDVGINFSGLLEQRADGVSLQYKIEQSSIAPEQSAAGAGDPVIRQALLEGAALLSSGKAAHLGGIDIPGSTRHLDITASLEPLP